MCFTSRRLHAPPVWSSYLPGPSGHLTMSLSLINLSRVPGSYLGSARVPVSGWSWTGSFVAAFGLRVLGTEHVGHCGAGHSAECFTCSTAPTTAPGGSDDRDLRFNRRQH